MNLKKVLALFIMLCMIFSFPACNQNSHVEERYYNLSISFIDVGQADSIFITCNGENMLIDAGNNKDGETVVEYIKSQGADRLKYVVGTHPHADHIGGMDTVINNIDIQDVILPGKTTNTNTFEDVLDSIERKGISITVPNAGDTYTLGEAKLEILSPAKDYSDNLNNWSIVIRLIYGEKSFLFMGDAETEVEKDILKNGYNVSSNVLKVGHHGSTTSSSSDFLSEVMPEIAIIQCGAGNDYGHPHNQTLEKLDKIGANILRTDENGTIKLFCDGKNITSEMENTREYDEKTDVSGIKSDITYVINTSTQKFHEPNCGSVKKIKPENLERYSGDRKTLIEQGYSPCGSCNP